MLLAEEVLIAVGLPTQQGSIGYVSLLKVEARFYGSRVSSKNQSLTSTLDEARSDSVVLFIWALNFSILMNCIISGLTLS